MLPNECQAIYFFVVAKAKTTPMKEKGKIMEKEGKRFFTIVQLIRSDMEEKAVQSHIY